MSIEFGRATKDDIDELIRLRIAYMIDDLGAVSENQKQQMEKQLTDYFDRKLGTELIAFVAREQEKIVSVAYLHIIEMPANVLVLSGLCGEVLNVYTEPEYRGQGLCTTLIKELISSAKELGLARIDLSATDQGFSIYQKCGFEERDANYTEMRCVL